MVADFPLSGLFKLPGPLLSAHLPLGRQILNRFAVFQLCLLPLLDIGLYPRDIPASNGSIRQFGIDNGFFLGVANTFDNK